MSTDKPSSADVIVTVNGIINDISAGRLYAAFTDLYTHFPECTVGMASRSADKRDHLASPQSVDVVFHLSDKHTKEAEGLGLFLAGRFSPSGLFNVKTTEDQHGTAGIKARNRAFFIVSALRAGAMANAYGEG